MLKCVCQWMSMCVSHSTLTSFSMSRVPPLLSPFASALSHRDNSESWDVLSLHPPPQNTSEFPARNHQITHTNKVRICNYLGIWLAYCKWTYWVAKMCYWYITGPHSNSNIVIVIKQSITSWNVYVMREVWIETIWGLVPCKLQIQALCSQSVIV